MKKKVTEDFETGRAESFKKINNDFSKFISDVHKTVKKKISFTSFFFMKMSNKDFLKPTISIIVKSDKDLLLFLLLKTIFSFFLSIPNSSVQNKIALRIIKNFFFLGKYEPNQRKYSEK